MRNEKDSLSKKEQDTYKDMRIVQEMYARGYEFWTIDLYKAQASRFQIIDGKLMPALNDRWSWREGGRGSGRGCQGWPISIQG